MNKKNKKIQNVYRMTPMQLGMLFHSLKNDQWGAYFEQSEFTLQGEVNIEIFRQTLNLIVKKYDIFRTVFIYEDMDEPLQVVLKSREAVFHFEDLSHLPEDKKKEHLLTYKQQDRKRGFNLSEDILMRTALFKTGRDTHKLVWSHHHILMDGWCLGIIYKDLAELYRSLSRGEEAESPNIRAIATYIKNASREWYISIEPREEQEHYPLSHAQQRLWVMAQMEKGSQAYNIPGTFSFKGPLNRGTLESAIDVTIQRHESLRTTFATIDGEPRQIIHKKIDLPLEEIELIKTESENLVDTVRNYINKEAHSSFDLEKGPLFRIHMLRLPDEETLVLLNIHHIISDAWSVEILITEVVETYNAYSQGEDHKAALPKPRLQYKDYTAWEKKTLTPEHLTQLKKFWYHHFDGEITPLNLPIDKIRPLVKTFHGQHFPFTWTRS